jgi:hypothetical protein
MRRPSPLKEGLRLTPSSVVVVMRRSETDCERTPRSPMTHSARAMQMKASNDLMRSTGGNCSVLMHQKQLALDAARTTSGKLNGRRVGSTTTFEENE